MDISSVNGAVSDALAGLPAGTSSFINANIGTPEGQQAILQAGLSLGLSQSQIAAAVSQATGMSVTPQQVAHQPLPPHSLLHQPHQVRWAPITDKQAVAK